MRKLSSSSTAAEEATPPPLSCYGDTPSIENASCASPSAQTPQLRITYARDCRLSPSGHSRAGSCSRPDPEDPSHRPKLAQKQTTTRKRHLPLSPQDTDDAPRLAYASAPIARPAAGPASGESESSRSARVWAIAGATGYSARPSSGRPLFGEAIAREGLCGPWRRSQCRRGGVRRLPPREGMRPRAADAGAPVRGKAQVAPGRLGPLRVLAGVRRGS
jgi:hypothetical protein